MTEPRLQESERTALETALSGSPSVAAPSDERAPGALRESASSAAPSRTQEFPQWSAVPLALLAAAENQGLRVKAFRLTDQQCEELRRCTAQDRTLYGYPVVPR